MPASEPATPGIGHNKASVAEILRDTQSDLIGQVDAIAAEANAARDRLAEATPEGEEIALRTEEERNSFLDIAIRAGKLSKKLDETRLISTKPLREEVDEHNRFFNTVKQRPDRIKGAFQPLIDAYDKEQRRLAAIAAAKAADAVKAEADRKLAEAASLQSSVIGDVVMEEAIAADNHARKMATEAVSAGLGPTRTEVGTVSVSRPWTHVVEDWSKLDLRQLRDSFTPDEIEKAIRKHVKAHKNTKPLSGVRIFQDEKSVLRG